MYYFNLPHNKTFNDVIGASFNIVRDIANPEDIGQINLGTDLNNCFTVKAIRNQAQAFMIYGTFIIVD